MLKDHASCFFSSVLTFPLAFVTFTLICWALCTMTALFWNKIINYSWADVVSDFGTESSIIHEEYVEIFGVVHDKFF